MNDLFTITQQQLLSVPLLDDHISPSEKIGLAWHWIIKKEPVIGGAIAHQLKVLLDSGVNKILVSDGRLHVNPEFVARLSCRGAQCVVFHEFARLLTPLPPEGCSHGLYETAVDLWLNQRLLSGYLRSFCYMPPVQQQLILSPMMPVGPFVGEHPVADFPSDLQITDYMELLAGRFAPESFDGLEPRDRLQQIVFKEDLHEVESGLFLKRCLPI